MSDQDNITIEPEDNEEPKLGSRLAADEGEPIPVKVRESVRDSMRRSVEDARQSEMIETEEPDPVVREYEGRYYGDKPKRGRGAERRWQFSVPPQHRRPRRPAPQNVSDEERLWAALAHGSALLTLLLALATGGIASLLTVFIPLGIYLIYREKSPFVAHHALQAFAAQVVGVIGFAVLLVTLLVTWAVLLVISAILVIVLVGLILFPLVFIAGLVALAATFILPLGLLIYSMIAAVQAWNGNTYCYPWIGDWVDDQLFETA
jgi:hypothetical protein